jgi:hypothetical protein
MPGTVTIDNPSMRGDERQLPMHEVNPPRTCENTGRACYLAACLVIIRRLCGRSKAMLPAAAAWAHALERAAVPAPCGPPERYSDVQRNGQRLAVAVDAREIGLMREVVAANREGRARGRRRAQRSAEE